MKVQNAWTGNQSVTTGHLWLVWRATLALRWATRYTVALNWTPAKSHWSVKQKHVSQLERPPVGLCSADAQVCSSSLKAQADTLLPLLWCFFVKVVRSRALTSLFVKVKVSTCVCHTSSSCEGFRLKSLERNEWNKEFVQVLFSTWNKSLFFKAVTFTLKSTAWSSSNVDQTLNSVVPFHCGVKGKDVKIIFNSGMHFHLVLHFLQSSVVWLISFHPVTQLNADRESHGWSVNRANGSGRSTWPSTWALPSLVLFLPPVPLQRAWISWVNLFCWSGTFHVRCCDSRFIVFASADTKRFFPFRFSFSCRQLGNNNVVLDGMKIVFYRDIRS